MKSFIFVGSGGISRGVQFLGSYIANSLLRDENTGTYLSYYFP